MRESLTECQLAKRGARFREDTSQGGACLPDGRGDVRRVLVHRQGIGCCSPRPPLLVDDALAMAKMKRVADTLRKEQEEILSWWERSLTNSLLEGLNSLVQSAESAARGFRSIAYFKTMILLRLGNSNSRPRDSWPVLPTRNSEEYKKRDNVHERCPSLHHHARDYWISTLVALFFCSAILGTVTVSTPSTSFAVIPSLVASFRYTPRLACHSEVSFCK
jgi:hypothetical protein